MEIHTLSVEKYNIKELAPNCYILFPPFQPIHLHTNLPLHYLNITILSSLNARITILFIFDILLIKIKLRF